ncbi:MAG: hypothetical protein ABI877_02795 [Gemmatimonadaceae bacterium]
MKSLRLITALLLAASSSMLAQTGPNLRVGLAALGQPVLLDTLAHPQPLTGDRAAVLGALINVYEYLGIPIDYKNTEAGIVVAERFSVRRQLGKSALSRYIDCGQGFNGVNANVYRITMVVASWLYPATGPVSQVHIAVTASGQDMAGSNTQSVLCTSKGVLEEELAGLARKRVALGQ